MKSLLALAITAGLLGCGQTGPLYMPKRPAVAVPTPQQIAPGGVPPTTDNGIPTTIPAAPMPMPAQPQPQQRGNTVPAQ